MADMDTVETPREGLICPHCKELLKDAVQTENGTRMCAGCFDEIAQNSEKYPEKKCGECNIDLKDGSENPVEPQFHKDLAIRKEIQALLVRCKWKANGCNWTGKLQEFESHSKLCEKRKVECRNHCGCIIIFDELNAHLEDCPAREVRCEDCGENVRHEQYKSHLEMNCPETKVFCEVCKARVSRHALPKHQTECSGFCLICSEKVEKADVIHLSEPCRIYDHMQSVGRRLVALEEAQRLTTEELRKNTEQEHGNRSNINAKALEQLKRQLDDRYNSLELKFTKFQYGHGEMSFGPLYTEPAIGSDNGFIEKIKELERANSLLKVRLSELELQLQASLASTHNGSFLWRIPDVARRKRDAIDEKITSIYSPPFYTGRNGYKMCIRAYLNGDGIGYKTHLSIFFVLMRGEFDPLLKWPFEHKVSLILVDQNHRKHIVQTFKPTPDSSSFQRPRSDMNVASGCPQFCKLDTLDDLSYVKDDVMYIKCIIDTSRIVHP